MPFKRPKGYEREREIKLVRSLSSPSPFYKLGCVWGIHLGLLVYIYIYICDLIIKNSIDPYEFMLIIHQFIKKKKTKEPGEHEGDQNPTRKVREEPHVIKPSYENRNFPLVRTIS